MARLEVLILAMAAFIGILDTSVMIPTVAAYAASLGADEVQAGLVVASYSYVALIASVVAGVLVDVLGRKRSLILGLAWDAVSVLLYIAARTPLDLALARGVHALGGSLVYPAIYSRAAGPGRRPDEARIALALAATALAVAAGIAAGGALSAVLGFERLYALVALALLAGAGLAALLPPDRARPPLRAALLRVLGGLRSARFQVAGASATIMLAYIGLGAVAGGLSTAILRDGLAASEEEASLVAGIAMGAAVIISSAAIMALGLASRGKGHRASALAATAASAVLAVYPILGPSAAPLYITAGGIALGGLMLASTLLAAMAPPESRGAAIGVQQVFNILGAGIGASLGGAASAIGGVGGVIVLAGMAGVASGIIAFTVKPAAAYDK